MPVGPNGGIGLIAISDAEFAEARRFLFEATGIQLSAAKKALVCSRLDKRLQARRMTSYAAYFRLLRSGADPVEVQHAVDLLTTNETRFFREPAHFDLLGQRAREHSVVSKEPLRAWSAASSSGEEAFSMAMVLADRLPGRPWEVVGTDVSARMVAQAQTGLYTMARAAQIPQDYLKRFCLKGVGTHEGSLLMGAALRERVVFQQGNLLQPLPELGLFDVVFLRNVLIYFDDTIKAQVVRHALGRLRAGGLFCVGHAESLQGVPHGLRMVAPSVYVKP